MDSAYVNLVSDGGKKMIPLTKEFRGNRKPTFDLFRHDQGFIVTAHQVLKHLTTEGEHFSAGSGEFWLQYCFASR